MGRVNINGVEYTPYKDILGWYTFEHVYHEIVAHASQDPRPVIVEVGNYHGASMVGLCDLCYEAGMLQEHAPWIYGFEINPQFSQIANYNLWKHRYYIDNKVRSFNLTSREGALWVSPDTVCAVYIDGDHSENAVYYDLVCWESVVKPGAIIAGHDYDKPGVKAGVNRFLAETGYMLEPLNPNPSSSFLFRKRSLA